MANCFFISRCVPGSTQREWALFRVNLERTLKANHNAMQNGNFAVDCITCHPEDKRYTTTNQRYWLEYHPRMTSANPHRNRKTHMIRPSSRSPSYALAEGLTPFSQCVPLTNADTYMTGPFDFAAINGRKTRDRVSAVQWKILSKFNYMFTNETPCLLLPDYSVHCGQFHTSFHSARLEGRLDACYVTPSKPEIV